MIIAVAALGGGATFASLRHQRAKQVAAAKSSSSADPTWCSPSGYGPTDIDECGTMSITGRAPNCLFWAECKERHVKLDCTIGNGQCRCDGPGGATIPFDPLFCTVDPANARQNLRAILDAAADRCRWRKQ